MLCPAPLKLPAAGSFAGASRALCLRLATLTHRALTLFPQLILIHAAPFLALISLGEGLFVYSEHCLCLGTALGRRNVFQIGLSPPSFSFDLSVDDQGGLGILQDMIAMTFLRKQSRFSVLYENEVPDMMDLHS